MQRTQPALAVFATVLGDGLVVSWTVLTGVVTAVLCKFGLGMCSSSTISVPCKIGFASDSNLICRLVAILGDGSVVIWSDACYEGDSSVA